MREYTSCTLCPRMCGIDRTQGRIGACRAGALPRVAHTMLHHWEEPCISGKNGSGAVFFSGCPLGCVYCQNKEISRGYVGAEYDSAALAALFLNLQSQGAHNINLVTATHHAPHVIAAVRSARDGGLSVPVVYNTSGYESVERIRALKDTVDVYLTDVRYSTSESAEKYSAAPDYPHVAMEALAEMVSQKGAARFDDEGMIQSGVVVRLLLLPGHLIEAKRILRDVYRIVGDSVYISLMSQYTPVQGIESKYPALARRVTPYEYASLVEYAQRLGVVNAYTQEREAAKESYIPAFGTQKL